MTPAEFIKSGEREQRSHDKRVESIHGRFEAAKEAAYAAYQRRLEKIHAARDAALAAERAEMDEREARDYHALRAAGHTYDEVRRLRGDDQSTRNGW